MGHVEKEAVLHESDGTVQDGGQAGRIVDHDAGTIEEPIALVRDVGGTGRVDAQIDLKPKILKSAADQGLGHRDHFDGQRVTAELGYDFGGVRDDDKAVRRGGDDLFAEKLASSAFDEREPGGNFIGAIDGQIEARAFFESDNGDAEAAAEALAVLGTGNRADGEAMITNLFAEQTDPEGGG